MQVSDAYDNTLDMSEIQSWVAQEIKGDEEYILMGKYKESPWTNKKLPYMVYKEGDQFLEEAVILSIQKKSLLEVGRYKLAKTEEFTFTW